MCYAKLGLDQLKEKRDGLMVGLSRSRRELNKVPVVIRKFALPTELIM